MQLVNEDFFDEAAVEAYEDFINTSLGKEYLKEKDECQVLIEEQHRNDYQEVEDVIFNPYINDEYAIEYKNKYTVPIKILEKRLLDGETGRGVFRVINFEAGLGKSFHTNKIIKSHLNEFLSDREPRNFLIVKRFNLDIKETVEYIKGDDEHSSVIGITSENWNNEWIYKHEELCNFRVVVISHSRYLLLCEQEEFRNSFCKGRHTLIIDEKVEFPIYTFSESIYKKIQSSIPADMDEEFIEISKPLLYLVREQKVLTDKSALTVVNKKLSIDKLETFRDKVKINPHLIRGNIQEVYKYFETLKGLSTSSIKVYNGGRIVTKNPNHTLWGLKNNIILDASADIDFCYKVSPKVKDIKKVKIINHSNCIIHRINYNSGKTSIDNNINEYFDSISELILERKKCDSKVLLVCLKEHQPILSSILKNKGIGSIGVGDDYTDEEVAINWFGNLVGKNTYRNFNQCWIIGTPNIPLETHIINHMNYSEANTVEEVKIKIQKGRFVDSTYYNQQISDLAGQIYQSIKRIQRNAMPIAEFFIVNHDEKVYEKVVSKMKKIKKGEVIKLIIDKNDKRTTNKQNIINKIVEYIKKLPKGKHKKKALCEALGINPKNLCRYLHEGIIEIKELIEAGLIEIEKQNIVKKC